MKFLCDVQIPIKLSKYLESLGHSSEHVNFILKKWNTPDSEIIEYVDKNNLILISKDQDFKNEFLLKSKPKKLLKVNLGNISNKELMNTLKKDLPLIEKVNNKSDIFLIEISKQNTRITIK